MLALIDRVRERATRVLGEVPVVVSCYEAGYDGFWLHWLLTAAGITNHVCVIRRALRWSSGLGKAKHQIVRLRFDDDDARVRASLPIPGSRRIPWFNLAGVIASLWLLTTGRLAVSVVN